MRTLCDRYGAVLIFDEVMTGFRVHPRGAQGLYGITPDLTTLGKVIGGGMPVGAFGGKRAIMECIAPLGPVYQAGTLSGNPVAVAAGLATLALTRGAGLLRRAVERRRARSPTGSRPPRSGRRRVLRAGGRRHVRHLFRAGGARRRTTQVMACDKERFNRFFHAMLDAGVYLAPSAYEAGFVSAAHGTREIAETIAAAEAAFAAMRVSRRQRGDGACCARDVTVADLRRCQLRHSCARRRRWRRIPLATPCRARLFYEVSTVSRAMMRDLVFCSTPIDETRLDAPARKRIGEILIERGKLDQANLERALRLQAESGERLGALLVTLGLCAQRDVAEALALQLALPLVDASGYPEFPILEERVSARFLREARALPVREDEAELGARDGRSDRRVHDRRVRDGDRPRRAADGRDSDRARGGARAALRRRQVGAWARSLGDVETRADELAFDADVQQLKDLASEAPVIRLVSLLITNALETRASDIHIEPFENRLIVRYRIDGVLHEVESPPQRLSAAVISRIKIMANLDIAERRLPQDGRIRLRVQGKEIDLRVSTRADDARRIGGDADPRQGRRRARLPASSASRTTR